MVEFIYRIWCCCFRYIYIDGWLIPFHLIGTRVLGLIREWNWWDFKKHFEPVKCDLYNYCLLWKQTTFWHFFYWWCFLCSMDEIKYCILKCDVQKKIKENISLISLFHYHYSLEIRHWNASAWFIIFNWILCAFVTIANIAAGHCSMFIDCGLSSQQTFRKYI